MGRERKELLRARLLLGLSYRAAAALMGWSSQATVVYYEGRNARHAASGRTANQRRALRLMCSVYATEAAQQGLNPADFTFERLCPADAAMQTAERAA